MDLEEVAVVKIVHYFVIMVQVAAVEVAVEVAKVVWVELEAVVVDLHMAYLYLIMVVME